MAFFLNENCSGSVSSFNYVWVSLFSFTLKDPGILFGGLYCLKRSPKIKRIWYYSARAKSNPKGA